jgi:hypothetical protein
MYVVDHTACGPMHRDLRHSSRAAQADVLFQRAPSKTRAKANRAIDVPNTTVRLFHRDVDSRAKRSTVRTDDFQLQRNLMILVARIGL